MDAYTIAMAIFVLLVGLCFGSFMNVVVLRAFSGESISYPASKCPKCQKPLYWWHNIPLLSYILLGGKCHFCKTHISWQYPIVEALTGILFLASYLVYGIHAYLFYLWAVIFMSLVLAITDIKEKVIFTLHAAVLALIGLIFHAGVTGYLALNEQPLTLLNNPLSYSVLGLLLGGALMLVYFVIAYVLAGGRMGMGDGDIYIAMAIGACMGWQKIWIIVLAAFLIQAVALFIAFEYRLYKDKKYKMFSYLLLFVPLALGYYLAETHGVFTENIFLLIVYTILLYGFGLYIAITLVKNISSQKAEGLCVPFGPALVLAELIVIFMQAL